jgi:peptide-methionine (S)-S-oxide reductase
MKLISLLFLTFANCNNPEKPLQKSEPMTQSTPIIQQDISMSDSLQVVTLAAGCFWCVEAIFQNLKGVIKVESGYSGGNVKDPSYREVCSGTTGHAEACQIYFDPKVISFEEILEVFWTTHDPTTLNQQGHDIGTQYRSAIFYHNEEQKQKAEKSKTEVATAIWDKPVVTEITKFSNFYKAEDYHQNYYNENSHAPYCQIVIAPKIIKLRSKFADKLKNDH